MLDAPQKNTEEYLSKRTLEFMQMADEELKKLGEEGKDRREEEEGAAVLELRKKHHVS